MDTEDNVIDFTGEWQGEDTEMSDTEYMSAMDELLTAVDQENLGRIVAGVLEFLTVRAVIDGPFYILTDDEDAMTLIAAGPVTKEIKDSLADLKIKRWEDDLDLNEEWAGKLDDEEEIVIPFKSNVDLGDEQDEPTA